MRIAVDMAAAGGQMTGLGRYASLLVSALRRAGPEHDWLELRRVRGNLSTPLRVLWDQAGLPISAHAVKPDALFVPAFSAPMLYRRKKIMTVHDLHGILFPELFSPSARWYWGTLLPRSARSADAVIVPSLKTAADLEERAGIPPARIRVIPLGADPAIKLNDNAAETRAALSALGISDRPFFLAVGTVEPRKNYPRLLEAFARSRRGNHLLVVVGKRGWGTQAVDEVVNRFRLQQAVKFLDYQPAGNLRALYNACTAFLMVSLYEGFGLPAVEAMNCGAPTLISDRGSLPEVGGEAALQVNPYDAAAITEKIDLLLSDANLRSRLQRMSLERARRFTWERAARETLAVLTAV